MERKTLKSILAICLSFVGLGALGVPAPQFSAPGREYVEYLVGTDHADRNYTVGENAIVTVNALRGGVPIDSVWVRYSVGPEMMSPDKVDSVMFSNGRAVIDLGTSNAPGFRSCALDFSVYGKTYKDLVKVGYSPEQIAGKSENPDDFDDFWSSAVAEATRVDLSPEIIPLLEKSTPTVEVSRVKIIVGENGRHFFGYLTRPKDGGKHPVLFCPPGAGASRTTPYTAYSDQGFIYLNINIHDGCDPELGEEEFSAARKATEGYNRRGIGSRDEFYYRQVYAGCSRAVDFLCSLPDWDGKNVGVTGGSQGGALTIVTAALNPKVTFCVPFYPALCDLKGFLHGCAGGWPKYFSKGNIEDEPEGAAETLPYYDVVNFARRINCPVYYSFGYADETCSPTSTWAAYNAISSDKVLRITPTSGHWRFPETNDESVAWMLLQCR